VTSEVADLLIKNARLPGRGMISDLAVSKGVITEIGPHIEVDAGTAVDARETSSRRLTSIRTFTCARSGRCR